MSTDPDRRPARDLAQEFNTRGDPTGWFEALYGAARGDASVIPWADLAPNPNLVDWLDRKPGPRSGRALVVGCGLGDDAEHLAARGYTVTAFDIAPSAIDWCRRRFPHSSVTYTVADLLDPPAALHDGFDFAFEAYTLQALPLTLRPKAVAGLAKCVARNGELLLVCRARSDDDPPGQMPWPLSRKELEELTRPVGLTPRSFEDYMDGERPPVRRFRCQYARAAAPERS